MKSQPKNRNRLWMSLGFAAIAIVLVVLLQKPNTNQSTEITVAQAYQKYQNGAIFLDIRTQEEWDQYHLENSTLIPLDQLPNRVSEIPGDGEIVVVCRSGNRSLEGVAILQKAGYTNVSSLSGGLTSWDTAGYPLIGAP